MSPITRETLIARITKLEADATISINEGFYLRTMRALLAEMDKSPAHPNGMMQVSNELAEAKAALRRLATYARAHAGDVHYSGEHPIAVAEKLAGKPVSERYTLNDPETPESSDTEHVASVLELIGTYEAADIDSDTVELRFEIDGIDTGSDVSITEYASRGAAIIRRLATRQGVKL